jgi:hypothetical protein
VEAISMEANVMREETSIPYVLAMKVKAMMKNTTSLRSTYFTCP